MGQSNQGRCPWWGTLPRPQEFNLGADKRVAHHYRRTTPLVKFGYSELNNQVFLSYPSKLWHFWSHCSRERGHPKSYGFRSYRF